ncbi:hypothetical protein SAMN05216466_1091 [Paraburkholderia phenazinium]|uniref:Uncharacterized protein n=1 Tax=Paraburkholderia phenazinium TaxID=60549 RepID=A0A1G8BCY3_9BURK|nr:hypothetical protein SAMN05216466_1091 [Paraburkholderia phenazinium]
MKGAPATPTTIVSIRSSSSHSTARLLPRVPAVPPGALSVFEINRDKVPSLRTESYTGEPPLHVAAGTTLESFVQVVDLAGGHVYAPLERGYPARRASATVIR